VAARVVAGGLVAQGLAAAGLVAAGCATDVPRPEAGRRGVPALEVEAPASLADAATRVRQVNPRRLRAVMALVGTERPGPPIRVVLAPEDGELAARVADWVAGYADGRAGLVVIFPARSPSYPDSSLEELVAHEVAHVLISRAAVHRPLPRWFNEGVAMVAGTSWGLGDRSRLSLAAVVQGEVTLERVERAFSSGGRRAVDRAYAISGAFVRDLLQRHGATVASRILEAMRHGLGFERAFEHATGTTLAAAQATFWRRHTLWYRWVPILTSSVTLWMLVALLALWAIRRRRARDAEIRERWEEEERDGLRTPARGPVTRRGTVPPEPGSAGSSPESTSPGSTSPGSTSPEPPLPEGEADDPPGRS